MVRTRTIAPAMYGGKCKVDETDVEEVAPCNPEPCPVECVLGDWDEWASCTASCELEIACLAPLTVRM